MGWVGGWRDGKVVRVGGVSGWDEIGEGERDERVGRGGMGWGKGTTTIYDFTSPVSNVNW